MFAVNVPHIRAAGGVVIAVIGCWGAWTASGWQPGDGLYPTAVFALVAVFGVVTAVRDLLAGRQAVRRAADVPATTAAGSLSDGAGGGGVDVTAGAGDGVAVGRRADDTDTDTTGHARAVQLSAVVVLTLVYAMVWDTLGYAVPTVVYSLTVMLVLGVRNIVALVVTPPAVTAFVLLVLGELLSIPFP